MKKFAVWGIIFVTLLVLGGVFSIIHSRKEVDNEIVAKTLVVIEDETIEDVDNVLIEKNDIYLPIEFIKKHFDTHISISKDGKRAFINLLDKNFQMEEESLTGFIKENAMQINIPLRTQDNIKYAAINQLEKIFSIDVNYNMDSDIVIIDRSLENIELGVIKYDDVKLYSDKSVKSNKRDVLNQGNEVRILSNDNDWYKVRTDKGYFGYVEKKYMNEEIVKVEYDNKINEPREQEDKGRVNITWEYVYEKTPDISDEEKIQGLDVVCPTWFSLADDGIIINKANPNYVQQAHEKGYKIWGLVDNGFDPEKTSQVINDKEMKNKVIAQIAFYASLYDLDGINIDFENIYYEDKDAFVKFVEDLTFTLKKQNLIVSIDVTVPGGSKRWSQVYDREKLSKIVDYVALMAYDEHWATSPVSGSVASIGWVERGIKKSLDSIPKEKLLLGIPFYTRVWKETKDSNGKIKVSSKAIPIKNVEEILEKYDAEITWNEDTGQNFATYTKDDAVYKVWIEDSESIKLKIELANKYGLKGIASWRKGYEYKEVWEVISTEVDDRDLL